MIAVAVLVLVLIVAISVVVAEARAPVVEKPDPVAHGRSWRLLFGLALTVISPSALLLFDQSLPVEPPLRPLAGEGCGSSDSSDMGLAIAIVVGIYLALRFLPVLIAGWIARRQARRGRPVRSPDGRRALAITGGLLLGLTVVAVVRLLVGGAAPDDVTTYGAVTPPGARGWRAEAVIAHHTRGASRPIEHGVTLPSDVTYYAGSDCCGALAHPGGERYLPGVQAWIEGTPVLITREGGDLVAHPVASRSESTVPAARRPHFASWPEVGLGRDGNRDLLIDRRPDGTVLAVLIDMHGDPMVLDATYGDAGLLLAPPLWPFACALMGLGVVVAVWRRSRRKANSTSWGPARIAAAWLALEVTLVLLATYIHYF